MHTTSSRHRTKPPRQTLLGVPIDPVTLPEALAAIAGWLDLTSPAPLSQGERGEVGSITPRLPRSDSTCAGATPDPPQSSPTHPPLPLGEGGRGGEVHHVVTVNPEFVVAARKDAEFAQVLREASLATADGVGIVLAGRLLGIPVGTRVTGVDLVEGLAALEHPACRLFFLGAALGVADDAARRLRERYPQAQIVGTFAGSPRNEDAGEITARLAAANATVLLVAFGHPQQDLWIARQREMLATHGILVAIGVGGSFDYLSGRVPRAPRVVRRVGLEWLYRLIRQPWRWRRQLALPVFVLLVVRERLRHLPLLQRHRG